jgi:hypothetical protein
MADYVLAVQLNHGDVIHTSFNDENNRDGCDISLGLYKANLGPITNEVLDRMLTLFQGQKLGK